MFKNIYIVAAKRTAFGKFGGKLKDLNATDMQVIANKAAIQQSKLTADKIDSVIIGNIIPSSSDAGYISRHAGLMSGCRIETPAITINRLCGTGFQSIVYGAQEILLGESKVVLCGGAESMSLAPYSVRGNRFGVRLGLDLKLEDTLWTALTDSYVQLPMAITAENLATQYNITRQECDEFALLSQHRWHKAHTNGHFKDEIAPVPLKGKKGVENFEVDEHARGEKANILELNKLPAIFKKDGTVTAGNASGVCDGAGAIIIADEDTVKTHNLEPLARFVSYHVSAVDPKIMGIGPVPAITSLLKKNKLNLNQIDVVEVIKKFIYFYFFIKSY
jgi:acetyl-CoA acyltransferase 2